MVKKLLTLVVAAGLCLTFGLGTANALPLVNPVTVSEGNIGDALVFPLYDVRDTAERTDGWQNYLTIANTSPLWTAAHIRFRTWRKSIEVYDHIILLSPYDVFYIVIERLADGSVQLRSEDTQTCLNSGLIYPPATEWSTILQSYLLEQCGYTTAAGYDLQEEMQAGYVEIFGLFQLSRTFPAIWGVKDTSDLTTVVNNLFDDGTAGNINVFDVQQGCFFDYTQPAAGVYAGLPAQPDWPWAIAAGFNHQDPDGTMVTLIEGLQEDPLWDPVAGVGRKRYCVDCGNVLYATMAMGDATTSQYEMANFIALKDFRTENWTSQQGVAISPLNWIYNPAPGTQPLHRDTHDWGAILFTVDAMSWLPYDRNGNLSGMEPYVNENFATTVGPGWRDGDDWNNLRRPIDPLTGFALAASGTFNWNAPGDVIFGVGGFPVRAVAMFNDIFSMDDVERVLMKNQLWYNYFNDAFGAAYQTDINITFPTKHYHWFFRDWVFWNDSDTVAPWALPYVNYPWVPAAPYPSLSDYWDALERYRGVDAEPNGAPANGSIAARFDAVYANGPVEGAGVIYNMDEQTEAGGEPPPGSPWIPVALDTIPHEANIISIGANTGTGIEEANGILYTGYDMGQFMIGNIELRNGQRFTANGVFGSHILYDPNLDGAVGPYLLPPVGVMIFDLNYAGTDYRSTMVPWDYLLEWDYPE